jgi:hypothetical protein
MIGYFTCVQDSDRGEAVEAHGLAHNGEGGGDQTLAANQGPSCGNHKAWPVHGLWDSLHDSSCVMDAIKVCRTFLKVKARKGICRRTGVCKSRTGPCLRVLKSMAL